MAMNKKWDIWSLDECHFEQHGSRCTMWVPPEDKDPIVLHAPTRKSTAVFGAVNCRSGKLLYLTAPVFNAITFQRFLSQIVKHKPNNRKMLVVLDNARWHYASKVRPWLKKHRKQIKLLFLPPYSPELNPIERVWKLTRRICTHNQYFPTMRMLVRKINRRFRGWAKANPELQKLCCII